MSYRFMICAVIGCIPVLSLILKCSVKVQPFARLVPCFGVLFWSFPCCHILSVSVSFGHSPEKGWSVVFCDVFYSRFMRSDVQIWFALYEKVIPSPDRVREPIFTALLAWIPRPCRRPATLGPDGDRRFALRLNSAILHRYPNYAVSEGTLWA